jgi:hypothetical protein
MRCSNHAARELGAPTLKKVEMVILSRRLVPVCA